MLQSHTYRFDEGNLRNQHLASNKGQALDTTDVSKSLPEMAGKDRLLGKFVNQMVASAFECNAEQLINSYRGSAKEARARQVSIYLMHTCLSFSLTNIAKFYGKDRTTVGHACRLIEDLRDEPAFDDRMIEFEQTISTVLTLAKTGIIACREVKND